MKTATFCLAFAALLLPCGLSVQAMADEMPAEAAAQLFKSGKFAEAEAIYEKIVAGQPDNLDAILHLGRIALFANRLDDAETWLSKAIALKPDDDTSVMLAEAYYRQDDFDQAAAALKGVDVAGNKLLVSQYPTLNVAKLESFHGQTPYEVVGEGQSTVVKFLRTDPLPLVSVRVNGGDEVTFFIDTGGSEIALDSEFAKELGIPDFGAVQGTFSGGQHAEVRQGRIDSLTLGDWTVKNLPVATLPLRQLSEGLDAKRIDGIVGTTLFYHFLATLDFRKGELVLRRKDAKSLADFKASAEGAAAIPFWIASDHFMVGWGEVESLPPTLLFVDTGLAGAGVKLAESVIKDAGIKLEEDKAETGAGGGGDLKIVPYVVNRLSFGDVVADNVAGLYDGPFPWQTMFGFDLAGMVGHDFFRPYAVTFDFDEMTIYMQK